MEAKCGCEVTCDTCGCCLECCRCHRCEECGTRVPEDDPFCHECDRCEDCCTCWECEECGKKFSADDNRCEECGCCRECCTCGDEKYEDDQVCIYCNQPYARHSHCLNCNHCPECCECGHFEPHNKDQLRLHEKRYGNKRRFNLGDTPDRKFTCVECHGQCFSVAKGEICRRCWRCRRCGCTCENKPTKKAPLTEETKVVNGEIIKVYHVDDDESSLLEDGE